MTHAAVAASIAFMMTLIPQHASAQTDLDAEEIYHPQVSSVTVITRTRCTSCVRKGSNFHMQLEAGLGYGAYVGPLGLDHVHGPSFSGAMLFSWGRGTQVGLRLAGSYGEMSGVSRSFMEGHDNPTTVQIITGYAAVQASFRNGLWIAKGLGGSYYKPKGRSNSHTLPELVFAFGYRLPLGQNFALQISGEVGSAFFLDIRASGHAGVVLRF